MFQLSSSLYDKMLACYFKTHSHRESNSYLLQSFIIGKSKEEGIIIILKERKFKINVEKDIVLDDNIIHKCVVWV